MKIAQLLNKAENLSGCQAQGKLLEEQFLLDKRERRERLIQVTSQQDQTSFPSAEIAQFLSG